MSHFAAVLDANVLVPVALADTLLRLAERDLFRPVWSERILDEVRRATRAVRPDLAPSRIESRLRAMNEVFDDACVHGWEPLVPGLELPDPDDRHVVAAAIRGRADLIVTRNLDDFPDEALAPLGIHACSPDEYLLDQLDLDPNATLAVIREQASAMRRPPTTVADVLTALELAGVPEFAATMRARVF